MDNNHIINNIFRESIKVTTDVGETLSKDVIEISSLIFTRLMNGNKIMACGNGGSAGDSQHFASELVNRFEIDRNELAALALTTDSSTITSIANDYGYENWVKEALKSYVNTNDTVILISSSGESQNLLNAANYEVYRNLNLVTFSGFKKNNSLSKLGKYNIWVDSCNYNYVEIMHNQFLLIMVDLIKFNFSR